MVISHISGDNQLAGDTLLIGHNFLFFSAAFLNLFGMFTVSVFNEQGLF
jgi:hypothetical protein